MIKVLNVESQTRVPVAEGNVRTILGPSDEGTRVQVAIEEVDPGKTCRLALSDRTQVAYILDGTGRDGDPHDRGKDFRIRGPAPRRRLSGTRRGSHHCRRRQSAASAALTVPKHTGKPTGNDSPAGYFFEEAQLRSLVDEKRFRERTFWVNKETGLSGSWDLQLGRMAYAPHAHSPRHVHHAAKTNPIIPEHFYLIEKGTGEVKHDTGSLPVGPGSLVLIPSGEWHQLIASETGFDYIEFQAPFDFVTTMDHDPLGKNWYIKGTDDGTGKPQLWVQS